MCDCYEYDYEVLEEEQSEKPVVKFVAPLQVKARRK